jgi:Putative zinc-finger
MDHHYIEGHNIPDRYLQGTLSARERSRFEEHFIDCAECLDRLEMTEDFRGALRTVAAEEAAASRVYARPGLRAWLMHMPGGRHAALLAAAMLLLVALPSVLLIIGAGQSRRQVDQARLSAADWQRKYEESQQAGRNAEKEMQAREQELSRQRLEVETQRERERQARVAEAGSRQALLRTAPIFDLNTVRGGTRGQSAPATRISIPRSAQWIVLKLEIEPDPELQSYRATLFTPDQQVICRASDVIAVKESLAISCDSSLFKPGDYRLALEGLTRQGRSVSAGAYSFHVIKQ